MLTERIAAYFKSFNQYYCFDTWTVIEAVTELAPLLKGKLLEVGCGHTPYKGLIEPFIDSYVATDNDASASSPHIVADAAHLPFGNETFDSILCTQVLEHVRDPLAVVREIHRALRPDGVALVTVPLNSGIHLAPHDYFRFTEFGLRQLCDGCGLTVELIRERGGRIATAAQTILLTFEVDQMPRRSVMAAVLRRGIRLCTWAIERFALSLDRRFPKRGNPLGYVLVARRPSA
jgi:SAM-dependent methyltransferase